MLLDQLSRPQTPQAAASDREDRQLPGPCAYARCPAAPVAIARLTAQLRCYVPEPVDETWGRLRHLGTRREQLITEAGSQIQQMRDLLECAWPAALDTARQPFRSGTWIAGLSVIAAEHPARGSPVKPQQTTTADGALGVPLLHRRPGRPAL
jgi:hypothetical protein